MAVAVAVAVAGLTKRFFNHIQKDFLINVWGYTKEMHKRLPLNMPSTLKQQKCAPYTLKT